MKPIHVRDDKLGEEYFRFTHKSGLTVFVIPKNRAHTFCALYVKFGAADRAFRVGNGEAVTELPDGVAHFLEHKLFEEEDGSEVSIRFARMGANVNAFTSMEETCYHFSCTENAEDNLRLLLHFVTHPSFSEESVAKERGIIGEEIDMDLDHPLSRGYANLMEAMYHVHPIRRRVCGTRESIEQITADLLYRVTELFYRPQNMALAVCGSMAPETVERICDEMLPEKPEGQPVKVLFPEEPETVRETLVTGEAEISQPVLLLGFKFAPERDAEKNIRLSLAARINNSLLFSRSGDFFNRLYESGLIGDRFDGSYVLSPRVGYAYSGVTASCDDPEALRSALLEEICRRREHYFSEEQFENARRGAYASCLFIFDSLEETALSCLESWGEGADYLDYAALLPTVTPEEAKAVLLSAYSPDRVAASILRPHPKK